MAFGISAGTYLAAGASLLGGYMSSNAAGKASQTQQNSAQAGQQSQSDALNRQMDLQEPFRQTGLAGNRRLAELLGISQDIQPTASDLTGDSLTRYNALQQQLNGIEPLIMGIGNERMRDIPGLMTRRDQVRQQQQQILDEFKKQKQAKQASAPQSSDYGMLTRRITQADIDADPVYQSGLKFGLDEGTKAINARATGMGNYDSGATLKALTKFGNDYGSTKANESYNRFENTNTNIYNRLAGISGSGQTATNQVQNAVGNYGNASAGLMADAGNARAAGIVGQANAWNTALGGLTDAWNVSNQNKTLDRILSSRGY